MFPFRLLMAGSRLLPAVLTGMLLSGCVFDQKMVNPFEARDQREAARQGGTAGPQGPGSTVAAGPPPVEEKIPPQDLLAPALSAINSRIAACEQKLAAWKSLEATSPLPPDRQGRVNDCKIQVQGLLKAYSGLNQRLLREKNLEASTVLAGESLLRLSQQDIAYLESDCRQLLAELQAPAIPAMVGVEEGAVSGDPQLKVAFDNGEYERVIALYERAGLKPGQVPPYEATFQYGQALLKNRREPEARKVFADLLARIRKVDNAQYEFQLLQMLGDLDFGLGSYGAARKQYEELNRLHGDQGKRKEWASQQLSALSSGDQKAEEIRAYADLLRSFLAYSPERDGYTVVQKAEAYLKAYPYSPVTASADFLLKTSREQADVWFNRGVKRIDTLAGERKFQEAQQAVEQIPRTVIPPDKQDMLRKKSEDIATTQTVEAESERLAREQSQQENWNKGMSALEAKEYDKAIEIFTGMLKTPYESKARARIEEASKLAAQEDRQRAADLFVRSSKTHDVESRKKLLLSSRRLLKDILVKYPQSGLNDKVERNLSRIEEEIRAIDPSLLTAAETVSGAPVPAGVGPVTPVPPPTKTLD